jgi:hypothetical protein
VCAMIKSYFRIFRKFFLSLFIIFMILPIVPRGTL